MNKKLIGRILAVLLASASVFAFSACNTDGGETANTGNGTENSGTVDNGTTDNDKKDDTTGGDKKDDDTTGGDEDEKKDPVVKPNPPVIPTVPAGAVKITKAAGDLEAAYAVWDKVEGAMGYNVYYKADGGEFVKLDAPLVREYKTYCRADAVGLKAGKYTLKVVPTGGADLTEDEGKAATATEITVLPHDRSGYAFVGGTSSGAYNDDGTLKSDAQVLYITDANKHSVKMTVAGVECVGLNDILVAYKKETKPLAVRLIGNVGKPDASKSDSGDFTIKETKSGVTFEGIGNDATANKWGLRIIKSSNVEVRNIGFMNAEGNTKDNIGIETENDHIWVHNCDMFYGKDFGGDQKKGDGALDTKDSTYVTHSYNHFWDSGKCNLQGMKSEKTTNYITYHHNWYDHSDSRHPRIRTCTVHIYNNYFDGNAKYGVGVTMGASAFVENNYFRSTKSMTPMLSSGQGTDALGAGTFSGESGGMIKAYGNTFDGNYRLITQNGTADKTNLDCYLATSRDEAVPSEYKTKSGGTTYNNFDTASDFYEYTVETPEVAKEKIEAYAGRVDGGDFKWEFDDATQDDNYNVIPELRAALTAYKSDLVKIGGEAVGTTTGGTTGGEGGDENTGGTVPEGVSKVEFVAANIGKYPAGITVSGNYKDGKSYLKMESATQVTVKVEKETVVTVHATGAGKGIKLNGNKVTLDSNGECQITVQAGGTLVITKGDSMELEYILLS